MVSSARVIAAISERRGSPNSLTTTPSIVVPLGDIVEPSAHDVPTTGRSQWDEAQPGRLGTRLDARNSVESGAILPDGLGALGLTVSEPENYRLRREVGRTMDRLPGPVSHETPVK